MTHTLTAPRPSLRRRALTGLAAAFLAVVGLAAASSARPAHAATVTVQMKMIAFAPTSLSVAPGTTVTWVNDDTVPHTVTSTSGTALNSPLIQPGQSWSYTFTTPGTYSYDCSVHPSMVASVTVTGGSTPTTMPGMSGGGGGSSGAPAGTCTNQSMLSSVLGPLVPHIQNGHLMESPAQQVGDITNVNQYAQVHTALVEAMTAPALNMLVAAPNALDPLIPHIDNGHLSESPAQQVSDLLNVNQYAQTHLVLVENMLAPITGSLDGTYGC